MTEMCRCGRDLHDSPLSEKVAGFWVSHSFDADYDPELDDSPILCPGSNTEGPLLRGSVSPGGGSWTIVGNVLDDIKTNLYTWLPGEAVFIEPMTGMFQQDMSWGGAKFSTSGESITYTLFPKNPLPWVLYDEAAPLLKAQKAIKKVANTLENLTCEKSDVVIEFGPKNWPVEPTPTWTIWQPWHVDVPPIYSDCWRESIQLPDLPVDYQKVAQEINEKPVSFIGKYSFSKLIGV